MNQLQYSQKDGFKPYKGAFEDRLTTNANADWNQVLELAGLTKMNGDWLGGDLFSVGRDVRNVTFYETNNPDFLPYVADLWGPCEATLIFVADIGELFALRIILQKMFVLDAQFETWEKIELNLDRIVKQLDLTTSYEVKSSNN